MYDERVCEKRPTEFWQAKDFWDKTLADVRMRYRFGDISERALNMFEYMAATQLAEVLRRVQPTPALRGR